MNDVFQKYSFPRAKINHPIYASGAMYGPTDFIKSATIGCDHSSGSLLSCRWRMLNFFERELFWKQDRQNDPDGIAALDGGGFLQLQKKIGGERFVVRQPRILIWCAFILLRLDAFPHRKRSVRVMIKVVRDILHHQADMLRIVQPDSATELGIAAVENHIDIHPGECLVPKQSLFRQDRRRLPPDPLSSTAQFYIGRTANKPPIVAHGAHWATVIRYYLVPAGSECPLFIQCHVA